MSWQFNVHYVLALDIPDLPFHWPVGDLPHFSSLVQILMNGVKRQLKAI